MIIATAGHIDHGKTALVEALTGVHSDRLPEEQRRGMSIDLGFAYASLTPDIPVGFVDVPGHEKFVRNMLAGVTSVDCALLVIAADDGPMPQTREHLDILDLLGIRSGVVALTKIDRVEASRIAEVSAEVHAMLSDTSLAGTDILPVCAPQQRGIDALKQSLTQFSGHRSERADDGFRLSIDRSFSLAGAGLVVTGHVVSGAVNIDDTVVISPQGTIARVRSIHANDATATRGEAGQRCALNLTGAGIRREQVQRGQWVVAPSAHAPTQRIDARVRVPMDAARALAHWTPVHLHLGTQDISARVAVLEGDAIEPGEDGLVRLMPNRPMAAWVGDRFIIRDQSARRTIGGGEVLDAQPPARGRARPERLTLLSRISLTEPTTTLALQADASPQGVQVEEFQRNWNLTGAQLNSALDGVTVKLCGRDDARIAISEPHWRGLREAALAVVTEWHIDNPERAGIERPRLKHRLPVRVDDATFAAVVSELRAENALRVHGNLLAIPGHQVQLPERDQRLWDRVQPHLGRHSDKPPTLPDLAKELDLDLEELRGMADRAIGAGLLVHVKGNRYFTLPRIRDLARVAGRLAEERGEDGFDAAAFRDASGIGRNVTIELLEYFDRAGLTRRVGNIRRLSRSAEAMIVELWTNEGG
ncbi:MAG: selenocysteine-specific translation elongation factor [Pseudomonadota bacterium]